MENRKEWRRMMRRAHIAPDLAEKHTAPVVKVHGPDWSTLQRKAAGRDHENTRRAERIDAKRIGPREG